ncbi:hypothetical protein SAMN04487962_13310 [Marinobacter segnicrescens]|uniref:Helix-turn-helix domain-containing protein n=1 Tax=Marinobacter segnicrescens TaxID=430453 RepID=A0A1I0HQU7_9GAMM|nr:hypothetical protein [Marinobacter segnicrescens]SET86503.1 hypothetical protein SAMN04487962_13310 [Marinobacter segnicrescens]
MKPEHDVFLTIEQLAARYNRKVSTVKTLVSRSPEALPPSIKLGNARNAPVRFRLSDCIKWEDTLMQRQATRNRQTSVRSLKCLLD